jgi:hypothetical protein
MSEQRTEDISRVESYRRAVHDDPAKLERFERNLRRIDSTDGVSDDLTEIARLLDQG